MAVVRKIKNRGLTSTVESHAEVLFMPGGDVNAWANRFTGRIRSKTKQAAPRNSRPRWAHYGEPLYKTITSARPRFWGNGRDKQRVYAAVGASAPHAYFVDQGTGIHGGNGAYEAKVLPPWVHGGASLYEATWRPGGPSGRPVAPVMIKGQKGQQFMAKGLAAAFRSMRMRSAQLPGEGTPKMTDALRAIPSDLENFMGSGNTRANPAFVGQLKEWRKWRDDAWANGEGLGRGGGINSRKHRESLAADRERIIKLAAKRAKRERRKNRPDPLAATVAPRRIRKPSAPKPRVSAAEVKARYAAAIKKERLALVAQAEGKYAGKDVKVSGRMNHDGAYAFKVTLTYKGREHSFWVKSDYQAAL